MELSHLPRNGDATANIYLITSQEEEQKSQTACVSLHPSLKPCLRKVFISAAPQHMCVSHHDLSEFRSPVACLVTRSKPRDPPHYKQQITALPEAHFTALLTDCKKHTCRSSILAYETVSQNHTLFAALQVY